MKRLTNYVTDNWKLKCLSLVLAVMLWFTVFLIGEMKKEITVPITFINLEKGYSVVKSDMERVDITLTGRVAVLKDVKSSDIKVTVNLSGAKEGDNIFNLGRGNVEIPKGVQTGQIKPSSVRVDIERIVEKKVRVVVRLNEKLTRSYKVKSFSPQYVTIVGPRRVWSQRDFIETDPVDGDFKNNEETLQAPLSMEGLSGNKVLPDVIAVTLRRSGGKEAVRN